LSRSGLNNEQTPQITHFSEAAQPAGAPEKNAGSCNDYSGFVSFA
jgi:hypothetical protein